MMLRCVLTKLVPGEVICLFCAASGFPKFPLYFLISYWRMPPGLRCQCFSVSKFWILCQGYVLSVQTIKTSPPIITYNWYRKLDHEAFFICVKSKIIIINCCRTLFPFQHKPRPPSLNCFSSPANGEPGFQLEPGRSGSCGVPVDGGNAIVLIGGNGVSAVTKYIIWLFYDSLMNEVEEIMNFS